MRINANAVIPERKGTAYDDKGRGFLVGFHAGEWWDMNVLALGRDLMEFFAPVTMARYTLVEGD